MSLHFLEEGRLPALDGVASDANQALLLEVLFWAVAYTLFVQVASRLLRALYRRSALWARAHKRVGLFLGNGRDDAVLLTCLGLHHGVASYLMYRGMVDDAPSVWRHGYLLETGFEVADFAGMALSSYPYTRYDGMKPEIQAAMVVHHLPGILLSVFIMETGLYRNRHMQQIVLSLLGGALISCMTCVYMYTLDFKTHMVQAAVAFNVNVAFFFYCRWYIFPREAFALLADVHADPLLSGSLLVTLLRAGGVFMALFNIGITVDVLPKTVRYVRRAVDGVTAIDTEDVPKSRDSVLFGRAGRRPLRRESSLRLAVDAVNPIAGRERRASLMTVMGMAAIEDMDLPSDDELDTDLDREDLDALHKTLGVMAGKSKSR